MDGIVRLLVFEGRGVASIHCFGMSATQGLHDGDTCYFSRDTDAGYITRRSRAVDGTYHTRRRHTCTRSSNEYSIPLIACAHVFRRLPC